MITAETARTNVINYEAAILANVEKKVNEMLDIISRSIEFHSKNGFISAVFCPYEKSRFCTVMELECAQRLFRQKLEECGFTVTENHYGKNVLKIEW